MQNRQPNQYMPQGVCPSIPKEDFSTWEIEHLKSQNRTQQQHTDIQDHSVTNSMHQKGKTARDQHTHTHCQSVQPINQICRMQPPRPESTP